MRIVRCSCPRSRAVPRGREPHQPYEPLQRECPLEHGKDAQPAEGPRSQPGVARAREEARRARERATSASSSAAGELRTDPRGCAPRPRRVRRRCRRGPGGSEPRTWARRMRAGGSGRASMLSEPDRRVGSSTRGAGARQRQSVGASRVMRTSGRLSACRWRIRRARSDDRDGVVAAVLLVSGVASEEHCGIRVQPQAGTAPAKLSCPSSSMSSTTASSAQTEYPRLDRP